MATGDDLARAIEKRRYDLRFIVSSDAPITSKELELLYETLTAHVQRQYETDTQAGLVWHATHDADMIPICGIPVARKDIKYVHASGGERFGSGTHMVVNRRIPASYSYGPYKTTDPCLDWLWTPEILKLFHEPGPPDIVGARRTRTSTTSYEGSQVRTTSDV